MGISDVTARIRARWTQIEKGRRVPSVLAKARELDDLAEREAAGQAKSPDLRRHRVKLSDLKTIDEVVEEHLTNSEFRLEWERVHRLGETFGPIAGELVDLGMDDNALRRLLSKFIARLQEDGWADEEKSLERFRDVPAVVAAFAENGVTLPDE